jgi:hypothetical protein
VAGSRFASVIRLNRRDFRDEARWTTFLVTQISSRDVTALTTSLENPSWNRAFEALDSWLDLIGKDCTSVTAMKTKGIAGRRSGGV